MHNVAVGQRVAGPQAARGVVIARAVVAPVQPPPNESHRLNHKKLHVTLAALGDNEVSNEQVLAMAKQRGTLVEWSIGDELHPTPADPNRRRHKHFYLHYLIPVNHRDARYCTYFDMLGHNGRVLHPHIQGVGPKKEDRSAVIYYTQKDRLYISSLNLRNFDAEATSARWSLEMNQAQTVEEGMRHLQEHHPEVYYLHAGRVRAGLETRIGESEPSMYSLADFTEPAFTAHLLGTKAIVLQGAAHVGKTQFALAHFRCPLLVSEMDDLKLLGPRNDGIVFDQMRFTHPEDRRKLNLTADEIIRLVDVETSRSIGARYANARIRRGLPRIFTTNRRVTAGEPIFPSGCNMQEQEGIDSRLAVTQYVDWDLRRNPGPNARGAGGP